MLQTLMPFITVLPFGAAMLVATIALAPSLVIMFRAPKPPPTTKQTVMTCAASLVGAWAMLNAATQLFTA